MITQEIRRRFLKYFKDHQHTIVPSSSVIPHDDPTLLFMNAGMNQFKDVFLGKSSRDYTRAATTQKCIRVGGKHNDFENVGHTRRHLTLFEMLGNFSFGDYFKEQAIQYAWEVSTEVFGFPPEKIWPTVFRDDDEAFELWTRYVPAERITRFGEKDNFWAMGETGPCGPCSELLFDSGPKYGSATKPSEDASGERYLEFWNLVFMQYNRQPDGTMIPLPKPSIDTGAGLERVVSLKMGVESVFETDVLRSLIDRTEQVSGVKYDPQDALKAPAFRVIADHLRCLAFAIADGAQPSNVDRGYVLRKVLRRAVRYGRILGMEEPFLARVLPRLIETMGADFPELSKGEVRIAEILTSEEEAFIRTLRRGGNILNQIIDRSKTGGNLITGDDAFKLKDTYGLPIDEITVLAKDAGLEVELERYKALEQEAKERSRSVHKTTHQVASDNSFAAFLQEHGPTAFEGYTQTSVQSSIIALMVDNNFVDQINAGEKGMVILDRTPFYAEMGGQVGDTGTISNGEQRFKVEDTRSPYKGIIAHVGLLEEGTLRIGDNIGVNVDKKRRQKIANNHTATHLLHWALHQVLGEHIKQAGSVVDSTRLRFDFNHHKALTPQEIRQIEDLINAKIRDNHTVNAYELDFDEVRHREDIKQFFGEKYGSRVRVIDIDYSKELCGGTHTSAVGNIGYFKIAKEGSIAAGVRRIEAVTGPEAEALVKETEDQINMLADKLKVPSAKIMERVDKLLEENKLLAANIKDFKKQQMHGMVQTLLNKVTTIKGMPVLSSELALSSDELRLFADSAMEQMKSGILILGNREENKCQLLIRVSPDLIQKGVHAGNMVKAVAPIIEGSGGGKPDNAQAGGKAPDKLKEALAKACELL